ncbi:MAG: 2,3-bisphosphoglycerate-independent phosphoglycerate mutase [candidate division NC10 bacterium]|nr:2,3-bisphosphoglycerate-independent phosphoglycerate mutase [candidate division NC10 bacterium]
MVLDGWGVNPRQEGNAIALARTPNMDVLWSRYPHTLLQASGEAVGLPHGQMGNSEVGHLNLGAGRIVYQDFTRISKAIREGRFFANPVLLEGLHKSREARGALHLLGLVSDGGVHSHIDHLLALLQLAKQEGLDRVFIHAFLDGRDTPPRSGIEYLRRLEGEMARIRIGKIATLMGRYYAMDRDNRWERVEKAYLAMVVGKGRMGREACSALEGAYEEGETDEFVLPTVITEDRGLPLACIQDGDGVIFFNFRADRAREITRALAFSDFTGFVRPQVPKLASYVCMTEYDETFRLPVAFPPQHLPHILAEELSSRSLTQLRIAETEKYAHVTFFFNGGIEQTFPFEKRCLIPSPKVATYDLQPEMSAYRVTEEVKRRIETGAYRFILLNYANPDMVGHTGILPAAISAIEAVDSCVGQVVAAIRRAGGIVLITADHGNAEQMVDYETGQPHTAHTTNPVPFLLIQDDSPFRLREGILADVAPTLMQIWGLEPPAEMEGASLLVA